MASLWLRVVGAFWLCWPAVVALAVEPPVGRGGGHADPLYRWSLSLADLRTPGTAQAAERRIAAAWALADGGAVELVPQLEAAAGREQVACVRRVMLAAIYELRDQDNSGATVRGATFSPRDRRDARRFLRRSCSTPAPGRRGSDRDHSRQGSRWGRGGGSGDPLVRWAATLADLRAWGTGSGAERRAAAARALAEGGAVELLPRLEAAARTEKVDYVRAEMEAAIETLSASAPQARAPTPPGQAGSPPGLAPPDGGLPAVARADRPRIAPSPKSPGQTPGLSGDGALRPITATPLPTSVSATEFPASLAATSSAAPAPNDATLPLVTPLPSATSTPTATASLLDEAFAGSTCLLGPCPETDPRPFWSEPLARSLLLASLAILVLAVAFRIVVGTLLLVLQTLRTPRPVAQPRLPSLADGDDSKETLGTVDHAAHATPTHQDPRTRWWRWFLTATAAIAGGLVLVSIAIPMVGAGLPNVEELAQTIDATRIHVVRNPKTMQLERKEERLLLAISADRMPKHLRQALVAKEDRRFFEHGAVDPVGVAGLMMSTLTGGARGGSTLTMQLARLLCMEQQGRSLRTVMRKLREVTLALRIEERYSKEEILTHYLNRANFGHGAFGVEVAARRFFHKSAEQLTLYESAMLIGVLPRPNKYDPRKPGADEREAARRVLGTMQRAGYLDEGQVRAAAADSVRRGDRTLRSRGVAAFFEWIRPELKDLFPNPGDEGLVFTTFDPELQTYAEAMLREVVVGLADRGLSNAAVVLLDPHDGAVRAMVGAIDFGKTPLNHATITRREVGSTFKPFVFLAALESGAWTPDSRIEDSPITFADGWSPRNADGRFLGQISLTDALAKSRNAATVRLQAEVGVERVRDTASRLVPGVEWVQDATLALGTTPISLLDITAAYAPFANGGSRIRPHGIVEVRSLLGNPLLRRTIFEEPVVDAAHVTTMNRMLRRALQPGGTGAKAALHGYDAAGKTGTTQQARDAWFIGYTTHLVAGVWMGNDDERRAMIDIPGGGPPAEVWRRIMERAHHHKNLPSTPLP